MPKETTVKSRAHNFVDCVEPGRTGLPYRFNGHRTCTKCGLSDVYVYGTDYVSEFVRAEREICQKKK